MPVANPTANEVTLLVWIQSTARWTVSDGESEIEGINQISKLTINEKEVLTGIIKSNPHRGVASILAESLWVHWPSFP